MASVLASFHFSSSSFHWYIRSLLSVHIFQSFHAYDEFNKLACSQRMVWVFIAHLVGHCSTNAEAMGSNPVEALKTFFGLTLRLLKSQLQLR